MAAPNPRVPKRGEPLRRTTDDRTRGMSAEAVRAAARPVSTPKGDERARVGSGAGSRMRVEADLRR